MRVGIFAVGRMKAGPERELSARYLDRFAKAGPALGLDYSGLTEITESRAQTADLRKQEEGRALLQAADGAALILLDETGKNLPSEQFAQKLADIRDRGAKSALLAIGGADGHDPALKAQATLVLSFGAATWPHQMVRIMLAEQLYRAATILSGHPYHRA
ncbi:MAG: 23S rRNA (pseudouridine(1915)-N(3))-methyltransferase RlmH [Mesorhizobium sp.]